MKKEIAIMLVALSAGMVMGESRFALLAYNLTGSSTPPAVVSPRFTASVSLDQEAIVGGSSSERFSLAAGFQAATEGFARGYDGSVDSTGNGVPDLWENRYFGGVGLAPDTLRKRGQDVSTHTVYVWGVAPHDEDAVLELEWEGGGSGQALAFWPAPGRLYDIWSGTDLMDPDAWQLVEGMEGISGHGEWIILDLEPSEAQLMFYRIKVRVAVP